MISRLTSRFGGFRRLQPESIERDAALLELVQALGVGGSIFHVLDEVPEQGEDLYTLLCDDQRVLSFEVPHGKAPLQAKQVIGLPVAEYRRSIGQGKRRIRLDETLKNTSALLGRQ